MGKEYSNTLRKRGMNALGKVVGQQQTLCTGGSDLYSDSPIVRRSHSPTVR